MRKGGIAALSGASERLLMGRSNGKKFKTYKDINREANALRGGFSRVTTEMQLSPAYLSLTASAHRLLVWCLFLNYSKATQQRKIDASKPNFRLTNAEARSKLGLNQTTFTRAKNELEEKGFLVWVVRGGLKGVNGVASVFALSNDWRRWEPAKKHPGKSRRQVTSA